MTKKTPQVWGQFQSFRSSFNCSILSSTLSVPMSTFPPTTLKNTNGNPNWHDRVD